LREIKYSEAILEATDYCMSSDPAVHLMGLGVPDPKGIFGTTVGLKEKFGNERVIDTPTSENGMTGVALGASMMGMRPVMTHQRVEFSLLAIEQIVNQAAKWHYMTGGKLSIPLVIRIMIGRGWGQGPQHSQSLESWFAHIPGLKVILPSTPYDAKGLLIAAIKDNNPVVFMEHRWLHDTFGEVPSNAYEIKIGEAKMARKGTDITLVTYSYMILEALRCANILSDYGISLEILDLRSLRPLDETTILNSVKKTGRLLVVDNGWSKFGVSSEIISLVTQNLFPSLKAQPERIGIKDAPIPSTRSLANLIYPGCNDIIESVNKIMGTNLGIASEEIPTINDVPDQNFKGPF
jgi:acetoin:2,6-dichlorophenolindophenol oxidoreductase subunit beta